MSKNKNNEKYTAKDIIAFLEERYSDHRNYTYATEVGNSTGMSQTRRIDFCVINHFESSSFSIEGVEVKISKSDLMSEIRNPEKHNIFFDNINYYSLACPHYILDSDIIKLIPPKWGIYIIKDGCLRAKRKPIPLHDEKVVKIDKSFVSSFIRRISMPVAEEIGKKMREEYERGYEEGKAKGKEIQESHSKYDSFRKDEYVENYRKLLVTLDTYHYELTEAIDILSIILNSDMVLLEKTLEDNINNMNKLNDIIKGIRNSDIKGKQVLNIN